MELRPAMARSARTLSDYDARKSFTSSGFSNIVVLAAAAVVTITLGGRRPSRGSGSHFWLHLVGIRGKAE